MSTASVVDAVGPRGGAAGFPSPRTQLALDVVLGTTARLIFAAVTSYRAADAEVFAGWARTMHDHPLRRFYAEAPHADHLPGDLWVLKALQSAFDGSGGDVAPHTFDFLTNAVPVAADVLVGVLLFCIVRTWRSEHEAARAARWYLLNPAVIVLAGVWGQWDAVSVVLVLVGLLLLLDPTPRWVLAGLPFAWAILTKPQLAVPVGALLLWVVLRRDRREGDGRRRLRLAVEALAFAALSLGAAVVLLEPFGVGLAWRPAGGWTLLQRVQFAADLHPFTTMGAPNVWMIADRTVIGPSDTTVRWVGLTPAQIGVVALVLAWCIVAGVAGRALTRRRDLDTLLWTAAAMLFASCLVLTRVHERYFYPVIVLLVLWVVVRGWDVRATALFWWFSSLFLVDLVLPMGWTGADHRLLHRPASLVVVGMLHVVFFIALIAVQWASAGGRAIRAGAPSPTSVARRTAPG